MKRILESIADARFDIVRLDTYLRTYYKMSGSLIKELKHTDDGMQINSQKARTIDTVHTGDKIKITLHETASANIVPTKLDFKIEYEDEDLIIVNKPPGIPTHPSAGNYNNTLANALMYYFSNQNEEYVFRAVNRLDKDTSGLMCIAKNKYIHARLCGDFKTKAVSRKYIAIVCVKTALEGTIDMPIGRCEDGVIKRCVCDDGQKAVTHYKTIKHFGDYSLIELELETGRTHQIRVHMSYIGHPLLGDWLYGNEDKQLFPRQALHSYFLSLTHPLTNEKMNFSSSMPQDMLNFYNRFCKDVISHLN